MTDPRESNDTDLHRWVDDRLDAAERESVEARAQADPALGAELRAYRRINDLLRTAYQPVADAPVPRHLLPAPRSWSARVARAAAALLWLSAGGVGGWFLHGRVAESVGLEAAVAIPAASAHGVYEPEVRHPVEVAASQEAHLVKWLSKRLGATVRAPDLTAVGYSLVGGRLLPVRGGAPAAQFMFQDEGGARMTLFVRRDPTAAGATAFRFAREDDISVFYWVDGPLAYALTGRASRESMLEIATLVHRSLNP